MGSPHKAALGVDRMTVDHVIEMAKTTVVLHHMVVDDPVRPAGIDVVMYLRLVGVIVQCMVNIMEILPVVIEVIRTEAGDETTVSEALLVDAAAAPAHHKHCRHQDKRAFNGKILERA